MVGSGAKLVKGAAFNMKLLQFIVCPLAKTPLRQPSSSPSPPIYVPLGVALLYLVLFGLLTGYKRKLVMAGGVTIKSANTILGYLGRREERTMVAGFRARSSRITLKWLTGRDHGLSYRYCEKSQELFNDSIGVAYPIVNGIPLLSPVHGRILDSAQEADTSNPN